ncbi:MAG: peptide-methionine (R)-S-oxide reductase MsrB [bacterium]|nr:peptide-methionine (R)-S-oxide reductase MsrB [bacterium]
MTHSDDWKQKLTPEQYRVLRQKGTEEPFTGKYWNLKDRGMYVCAACGSELFSSDAKFESGTGWPSFWNAASKEAVEFVPDGSHSMSRIEVRCRTCQGHLGHVFEDGPREHGGKRFCINSCSLELKKPQSPSA